ncbi:MAG: hypothetical protein R3A10_17090 [Caldilineaceae bacterium]
MTIVGGEAGVSLETEQTNACGLQSRAALPGATRTRPGVCWRKLVRLGQRFRTFEVDF